MQRHDSAAPLSAVLYLVVGLKQSRELQGNNFLRENPCDGVIAQPLAGTDVDYVPDLIVVQGGMLGLEIHDNPADRRRQQLAFGAFGRKESPETLLLEALDLAVQRPLGRTGFPRPLGHRTAEEHQRTELFVLSLLGPLEKQNQLIPVVGRLPTLSALHTVRPPSLRATSASLPPTRKAVLPQATGATILSLR